MNFSVTLPWPPANVSTNHQWIRAKVGMRTRPEAVAYKNLVATMVRQEVIDSREPILMGRPLAILIRQFPPNSRKRDVDSNVKIVMDAVAVGLDIDDVVFSILTARMDDPDKGNPRIEVMVIGAEDWLIDHA